MAVGRAEPQPAVGSPQAEIHLVGLVQQVAGDQRAVGAVRQPQVDQRQVFHVDRRAAHDIGHRLDLHDPRLGDVGHKVDPVDAQPHQVPAARQGPLEGPVALAACGPKARLVGNHRAAQGEGPA